MLDVLVLAAPLVAPCGGEDAALELGAVLHVVLQADFGRGVVQGAPFSLDAGQEECGEAEGGFGAQFCVVVAVVSFEPCDGFVGASNLEGEGFGAAEEVFVLVGGGEGCAEVACRVGGLDVKPEGVWLGVVDEDVAVEGVGAWPLGEADAGEGDGRQACVVGVGALEVAVVVGHAGAHHGVADEQALAEVQAVVVEEVVALLVEGVGCCLLGGEVGQEVHRPDGVSLVGGGGCASVFLVELDAEQDVHLGGVVGCVSAEAHVFLVESVVSVVSQVGGDAVSLGIEGVDIEGLACLQQRAGGVFDGEEMPEASILDNAADVADGVALMGIDVIEHFHLLSLFYLVFVHGGFHVACIAEHLLDVVHRLLRFPAFVEHGGFANLAEEAAEGLGGVGA